MELQNPNRSALHHVLIDLISQLTDEEFTDVFYKVMKCNDCPLQGTHEGLCCFEAITRYVQEGTNTPCIST